MKREYPKHPIPGIGVVVFKEDHVLLIRRNKPPKEDEWSIPGGAQDLGETLLDCARREVREETGIEIENITLLKAVDFIDKDENNDIRFHYSLIDYMADYKSGDLVAGDDAFDAKWVHIDDFKSYNLWQETIMLIEDAIVHRRSQK